MKDLRDLKDLTIHDAHSKGPLDMVQVHALLLSHSACDAPGCARARDDSHSVCRE